MDGIDALSSDNEAPPVKFAEKAISRGFPVLSAGMSAKPAEPVILNLPGLNGDRYDPGDRWAGISRKYTGELKELSSPVFRL